MTTRLRLLLVEDSLDDAALVDRQLRQGGYAPQMERVETAEGLQHKLTDEQWDLVIADYVMPHFDGLRAIQIVREHAPHTPVILISGKIGEELAVAALKAGAANYIMKDKLKLLASAVDHELKAAQLSRKYRELEQQNQLLSLALRQSPVSILITDSSGITQYANPRVTEQTGYRTEELVGQSPRIFKSGETPPEIYGDLWGSLLDKSIWNGTLLNRKKNGELFWEQVSIAPVIDDAGNVTNFVAFKEDISERIQQDYALKSKNVELESFTYTVSHDLRSPLVTFKTFLGYLQEDLEKDDHELIAKDIAFMEGAANKMEQLLNGLLSLSRIGQIINEPATVSFRELVDEALETMAGHFAQHGVSVKVMPGDIQLCGDSLRLQEVWLNLLENAIKYMGNQPEPQIWIGAEQNGDDTVFFVQDNGMGIAQNFFERIFGLFEKLDTTSDGIGIGLALVKKIILVYCGRIWVESDGAGKGSCFKFTLPGALSQK
jgi:PAS domain S-box-containing protein